MNMEPRRSIQDIIPPARSRPIRVTSAPVENPPQSGQPPKPPTPPPPAPRTPMKGTPPLALYAVIAGVAVAIGLVVIVVMSTVFNRAYVTVAPNRFEIPVSTSFQSSSDGEKLPYQRISAEETVSRVVPATGTEQVSERSSGTVVVYNALSEKSQRLVTNTRFQNPDGLIYRAHSPITIPGYTTKAGVKVPGSVEVTVYAEEPGEKYNSSLVDLTLPALSTAEQALIYAKSKTAMSGGFVGERAVVDPTVKADAVRDLTADLTRSLSAKLLEVTPSGSVIFGDTVTLITSEVPDVLKDERNATISLTGTATAPSFSLAALATVFAEEGGIAFEGSLVIENPNDLVVSIDPPGAAALGVALSLSVSGTAELVAVFDASALANALAGKKEGDISAIRAAYPGIESMDVKVYPFWSGAIPTDPKKVTVKITGTGGEVAP